MCAMCAKQDGLRVYEGLRLYESMRVIIRTVCGETRRGFVYAVDPETGNVALLTDEGGGMCLIVAAQVIGVVETRENKGKLFLPIRAGGATSDCNSGGSGREMGRKPGDGRREGEGMREGET